MDLLVGSMHEHRICCILHISLCSLTVWFSVNVNWYGTECNFVPSYYCPPWIHCPLFIALMHVPRLKLLQVYSFIVP